MKNNYIFLFISILKFALFQDLKKIDLINKAKEYGYNLRNPEDPFFHDICAPFKELKKDISLEYRRKNFFFPTIDNDLISLKLISQTPKRNNSNYCFRLNISFSNIFKNVTFIFFLPMFIFQFSFLFVCLLFKTNDSIQNTPYKKVEALNKRKDKKNKNKKDENSTYSKFIPEFDIIKTNEALKTITETDIYNEDNKNKEGNLSEQKLKDNNNIHDYMKQNSSAPLNIIKSDKVKKSEGDNSEPSPAVEKSVENYTFGFQFGKEFQFSSNHNIKEEVPEKNEDKMKRIKYVYEQINQKNKEIKTNKNNNINADTPITISNVNKNLEIFYTREEYFYFGYLLARIEDKRTLFEIYIDLLEQCQIIFKFLYSPFNIYEDRKLQIFYYLTKINLYFLFNCLLIKTSVINDIYEDKNHFINDLIRSILSTVYTYGISLFIYYLTNIKKLLIKRRYKFMNLKINVPRWNNEFSQFTYNFCKYFLFNKLILLSIVFLILFLYSFYICFSFCNVYVYTQYLLLKCVLLSITLSLIIPFIACWIPAFLRKLAIKRKNPRFYDILKIIESLFVPW